LTKGMRMIDGQFITWLPTISKVGVVWMMEDISLLQLLQVARNKKVANTSSITQAWVQLETIDLKRMMKKNGLLTKKISSEELREF